MKYTKESAKYEIEMYKNSTAYFDGDVSADEMYTMLRFHMGFGEAEAHVIIAALILSGAKFELKSEEG